MRLLVRPRHRWKYNIKMGFKWRWYECVELIHLAWDEVQSWAFVNMVMNNQVTQKAGNFLSSWTTVIVVNTVFWDVMPSSFGATLPVFQRNVLLPSSWSMSKPGKKPVLCSLETLMNFSWTTLKMVRFTVTTERASNPAILLSRSTLFCGAG
jgi:hypothetical protein